MMGPIGLVNKGAGLDTEAGMAEEKRRERPVDVTSRLRMQLKRPIDLSPRSILVAMTLSIFAVELIVMLLLSELPPLSRWLESLLDATVLIVFLSPFYIFVYRPFWNERQQYERQISYLSRNLLTAAEEERKRVTHELHDECGQTLTALQFGIQTLKRRLPADAGDCSTQVDRLIEVAAQLGDELRKVTTQLRPSALDEFGLHIALRWLMQEFSESYPGVEMDVRLFRETDLEERLPSTVEDAIYRVCQEALTNVARYSLASKVQIRLMLVNSQVVLQIQDNGQGFDLNEFWKKKSGCQGIGLLGMRERTGNLHGSFGILSAPGEGTSIEAIFPLTGGGNEVH